VDKQDLQWMISVDDHIIEPPNLWVDRASVADRDRVPHVERIDGVDTWIYDQARASVMGILVAAHQRPAEYSPLPVNYDEMPRAYFDPAARIPDMDEDHVIAGVNFPFFPRFCGQMFAHVGDRDLGLKCVREIGRAHV